MSIVSVKRPVANTTLAAASEYARRGWPVFPIHAPVEPRRVGFGSSAMITCSCGRASCENQGKHPANANGFRGSSSDVALVKSWFDARPWLNIAIATGEGLLVVDVDPRNGGDKTLAELERANGPFPRDAAVITGGGGIHLYYRYDAALSIRSVGDAFGPGVDLKADGGYVVAPPSLHRSGRRYRWLRGKLPVKIPLAPKWLRELAESPKRVERFAGDRPSIKTSQHPEGMAIAKLLGARDCGTYWRFECPVRQHTTPDAAMYPWPNGKVNFVCYSKNACSHFEILAAVEKMVR